MSRRLFISISVKRVMSTRLALSSTVASEVETLGSESLSSSHSLPLGRLCGKVSSSSWPFEKGTVALPSPAASCAGTSPESFAATLGVILSPGTAPSKEVTLLDEFVIISRLIARSRLRFFRGASSSSTHFECRNVRFRFQIELVTPLQMPWRPFGIIDICFDAAPTFVLLSRVSISISSFLITSSVGLKRRRNLCFKAYVSLTDNGFCTSPRRVCILCTPNTFRMCGLSLHSLRFC
mmetsp:Transcript_123823/g.346750  ORF Transcript_123823/g.346750 Transcript_123823/m.346750 type:complete len:237 (+) Transcript_123823:2543-3253(+)